ncbi:E3 ubiquitin-protein ligase NRDP1-like [Drosophila tropicalis]|uniref:E3 ubiquitin-protein ligase NRDP1-like n=1 Tax=Drosophila tropicalis TaxID=46794 RepID=UPI0035AC09C7
MGFDIALIIGRTDEELFMFDMYQYPGESSSVVHLRARLLPQLVPASRLMRNMLGSLKIKCCYFENGCQKVVQLEDFRSHLASCYHNTKRDVRCPKGCGMKVPKDEMSKHNCVVKLREFVMQQRKEILKMKVALAGQQQRISSYCRDIEILQHYITGLTYTNSVVGNIGDQPN